MYILFIENHIHRNSLNIIKKTKIHEHPTHIYNFNRILFSIEIHKLHKKKINPRPGSSHSNFFNFSCFSSGRAARALTVSAKHVAPPSGGVCLADSRGNLQEWISHGYHEAKRSWQNLVFTYGRSRYSCQTCTFLRINQNIQFSTMIYQCNFILAMSFLFFTRHVFGKASWITKK